MTAARSDLMALDPLEMLLDAARFADSIKPEWAKAARKAVAAARLATSQPDREAVARAILPVLQNPSGVETLDWQIADAILSLLSGAGTKSDGGCNCSWGCVEADNCRRKLGPLPDWKQDQSETSRIKPRPSDPSPDPDVKPAPIADSSEAGTGGDAMKRIYDKLASEGGGTWATYMMIDIEEAFAALSAPVGEPDPDVDAFIRLTHRQIVKSSCGSDIVERRSFERIEVSQSLAEKIVAALTHPPAPAVGPDVREAFKSPIKCAACGKMYSDHAPEGDPVCECAARSVRALKEEMDAALTRPLGGFVQGSIARKQSTDTEGSSRTETAGGEG